MKKLQSVGLARCCLTLVLLICGANATFAQEVTATVAGTVTDPSGAAVVGATVTAEVCRTRHHSTPALPTIRAFTALRSCLLVTTTFASRRRVSKLRYTRRLLCL